jgi:hypothetical protein
MAYMKPAFYDVDPQVFASAHFGAKVNSSVEINGFMLGIVK